MHSGTIFAAPFDLDRLEMTGQPVPVLQGVAASVGTGAVQLAVSPSGTLVYLSGEDASSDAPIAWMDRSGKTTPLRSMPSDWSNPRFSPDGSRLAMDIIAGASPDVWVYEWSRDTLTRLTFDAAVDVKPVWTPDGRRITFISARGSGGSNNVFWQRADGTGDVQRLTESKNNQLTGSWHRSGKLFAYTETTAETGADIMILPMDGDERSGWTPGKPTVFQGSPFAELEPMFSPDGRWLAYQSNATGQAEVYVRPFPGPGGLQQISTDGGAYPMWSGSRSELLYINFPRQQVMTVSYTSVGDSFRADKPRIWSPGRFLPRSRLRPLDVHPDGQRVALAPAPEQQAGKQDKVLFVFNFFDELRRLAPAK
jgi:serine/threonine-protein kinase